MDYAHVEELEVLYEQLSVIRKCLEEALEEDVKARLAYFEACAKCGVGEKLSEQSRLIVLSKQGYPEVVKRLIEAEKDVTKAKAGFKVAEHAINIKKHLGNIQPRG